MKSVNWKNWKRDDVIFAIYVIVISLLVILGEIMFKTENSRLQKEQITEMRYLLLALTIISTSWYFLNKRIRE